MTDIGTVFTDNTVYYSRPEVPPSSVEFLSSGKKVNAGAHVPRFFGLNQQILYEFFPGIPPPPQPVKFIATSFSEWVPTETVTVTGESVCQPYTWRRLPPPKGPSGDDGNREIHLRGSITNLIAIFKEEKVDE